MKSRTRIAIAVTVGCLGGLGCEHHEPRARVSYPESVMSASSDRIGRGVFASPEVRMRMQTQRPEQQSSAAASEQP